MRPSIRATGDHPRYHLVGLTALLFWALTAAASAQAPSDNDAHKISSARIRRLLSNEEAEDSDAINTIFKMGNKAVPTLVRALRDQKDAERAVWALVYLGGPKERKILLDAVATEKDKERKLLMSSFVAGAMVEPTSEEEWSFLASCIRGYRDEDKGLAAFYAALALGENGSQRALKILQTAGSTELAPDLDNDALQEIGQAIRWIKKGVPNRPAISAEVTSHSEQIKQVVLENAFYAEGERADLSVEDIIFTSDKDRALASLEIYHGPKNARGYDIVLEHRSGTWKIVGIWATWVA